MGATLGPAAPWAEALSGWAGGPGPPILELRRDTGYCGAGMSVPSAPRRASRSGVPGAPGVLPAGFGARGAGRRSAPAQRSRGQPALQQLGNTGESK